MNKVKFTKMIASGNDFVIIDYQLPITNYQLRNLARNICDRKYGVGADGLLILEKSKIADVKMRIFNADGSEAQMCGNGARCVALYLGKPGIKIETKAGIIESEVSADNVKIRLTDPRDMKLGMPIKVNPVRNTESIRGKSKISNRVNNRILHVNFINTGVPHTVIFVEGLDKIDIANLGKQIRFHKSFAPCGTNVDFVEILNNNSINIRTYERGVEDETLACGTGAVASALITNYQLPITNYGKINVQTRSGEILKVYFEKIKNKFKNIWLEGKARIVYSGVYYV